MNQHSATATGPDGPQATGVGGWLRQGWGRFRASSLVSMSGVAFFVVLGLTLEYWLLKTDRWLIYFILAWGFFLISPFLLSAYYQEAADKPTETEGGRGRFLALVKSPAAAWAIALITGAIYLVWITDALIIYSVYFGFHPIPDLFSNPEIRADVFSYLLYASLLGVVLSLITFPVTVLSLPHIIFSGAGFVDAIVFSVKGVARGLPGMLLWALVIGIGMLFTLIIFLPAALVVFPVLAHANAACYKEMVRGQEAQ